MATLPEIRAELADTAAQVIEGKPYRNVAEAVAAPCVIVQTRDPAATYEARGSRNLVGVYHLAVVLIAGGRGRQVEDRIGVWLDPTGPLITTLQRLTTGSCAVETASQIRVYPVGSGEYLGVELVVNVRP